MQPSAATLKKWREHPVEFVRDLFAVEPDEWQKDALEAFPHSPRLAMRACAGPGKTAVLGWLGWNFMVTRPHAIAGATSISGDNLKANLWTELARWRQRAPLLQHTFEMTKTEIYARESRDTWKMEARTWAQDANPEQIGNALRGLHGPYVMWLLDESGDYPDSIMPVVENIFSGAPKEAHIVQAGNPTQLSGPLYRACVTSRDLWHVIEITGDPDNPKRSPRISIEHARAQIKQYGRDDPWVLVNIFGEFPQAAFNTLLSVDEVLAAMDMKYQQSDIDHSSRILGVDVARGGMDNSVIFPRQGLVAFKPMVMRNVDSTTGAGQVSRTWDDWKVDACFIDDTGGYGSGWIDQLINMNRAPIGINFQGRPIDQRYANRRAEMYFSLRDWIRRGGCLPYDKDLLAELPKITSTPKGGRLLIEPKEVIKKKIGRSPDKSDALVLTFAEPVGTKQVGATPIRRKEAEYDPFEAYR